MKEAGPDKKRLDMSFRALIRTLVPGVSDTADTCYG